MSRISRLRWWVAACLLGSVVSCAAVSQFNILSTEQEVEMGREAALQVERELRLYNDPAVAAYINSLGRTLARHSRRSDLTYYFKVVDTDEVNAFALPGGWLYVNRGLITTAENESELAAVIGHEIGHVDGKHGAEAISRQLGAAFVLEMALGGKDASSRRRAGKQIAALFIGMKQLSYGRDAEREADRFAVEATYAAGIDPEGTATFFEKLMAMQKKEPGRLEFLFSTHPPSRERVNNVRAQIEELPPKNGLRKDSGRFQAVKKRIMERKRARRSGGKKAGSRVRRGRR